MTNTNDIRRFFELKEDTNVKEGLLAWVYNFCQKNNMASDWYANNMMKSVGGIETEKPVIISRKSSYFKAFETAVAIEDIASTFENSYQELKTVLESCSEDLHRLEYLRKMLDKRYSAEEIEYCFKNKIFLKGEYHKKFDYDIIIEFIEKHKLKRISPCLLYNIPIDTLKIMFMLFCDFNGDSFEVLLQEIDTNIEGATEKKLNCVSVAVTEWRFKPWEVNLFIPILFEMNDIEVNKLKLFMSVSKKEELFKKVFDI